MRPQEAKGLRPYQDARLAASFLHFPAAWVGEQPMRTVWKCDLGEERLSQDQRWMIAGIMECFTPASG